jgi:hypothetical protein
MDVLEKTRNYHKYSNDVEKTNAKKVCIHSFVQVHVGVNE